MANAAAAGAITYGSPAGRRVLLTTVLGSGIVMLDGTVVNVALPTIGRDLNASTAALQWIVNAYTLTLAGFILLGGALGDRYGRRRVFVVGVVWFAVASLLCGLAPTAELLTLARALQGAGGALLTPGSLAIIQAVFVPDDRARAVGAWSGLGGVATAIGPFLGGWLVDAASWRWIFFINLPLAALAIAVAARHVPETYDPGASGRFDVTGAVLAALALAGVTWSLIVAPTSPVVAGVAGAAGVAAGVAFVLTERRVREPMLPPDVFASRQFTAVNVVTLCVYAALSAVLFFLVLQLQTVSGYSPQESGLATLPMTILMLLLSARAGQLAKRIGPRVPMTVGPLLCAGGLLLMLRIGPGASYAADVLPAVAVLGLGLSVTVAPLTATVLASVDVSRAGIASGVNNAAARAAGLLAVAGLPAIVGLTGDAYREAPAVDSSFGEAMAICAGLMVAGAVLSWLTVRADALEVTPEKPRHAEPACRTSCPVNAPPLEADAGSRGRPSG